MREFFFPTRVAIGRASDLQQLGVQSEGQQPADYYDADDVTKATIHARQDLVLIYSMQCDLHRQMVAISRGIWLLLAVVILFALR